MMMRGLIVSLAVAGSLVGCTTDHGAASGPDREVQLGQANDLALVQLRAQDLRPGMSQADVYTLLGAPAEYRGDVWIYRGQGEVLVVRFKDERFTGLDDQIPSGRGG